MKFFEKKYDSKSYWSEHGRTYYDDFQTWNQAGYREQESKLNELLKSLDFNSVLEIGCGFGRITKLILDNFPNVGEYRALDISREQILRAKEIIGTSDAHCEFIVSDFDEYASQTKFDLVLASEVLMHIEPDNVKAFLDKMIHLSNKHIVTIDAYPLVASTKLAKHNFIHDYPKLYGIPVQQVRSTEQVIFHAVKSEMQPKVG